MMFEKKARELLNQYIAAEQSGQDELASAIEGELNAAGWYITSISGVLDVVKKGVDNTVSAVASGLTDFFLPKESRVDSYRPPESTSIFTTKNILIAVGALVGTGLLIWLIVWVVNRKKAKA